MQSKCHVRWLRFHFKGMLITGLGQQTLDLRSNLSICKNFSQMLFYCTPFSWTPFLDRFFVVASITLHIYKKKISCTSFLSPFCGSTHYNTLLHNNFCTLFSCTPFSSTHFSWTPFPARIFVVSPITIHIYTRKSLGTLLITLFPRFIKNIKCTIDMINIDRQHIQSFWSHKIAL